MKNLNLNQNIINKNYFIDSRDVKENSVFICIKGPNNDGHNYVNYVLNNFSKTIVVCEKHWKYAKKFEKNKRVIFCDSTSPLEPFDSGKSPHFCPSYYLCKMVDSNN